MNHAKLALLGTIALGFAAGPAVSQTPVSPAGPNAHMAGSATMHMSDADKKSWSNCKIMSHEAMMKDATCSRIMKDHPDAKKWATKPAKPGEMKPDAERAKPESYN
jgi:hypothetical protein